MLLTKKVIDDVIKQHYVLINDVSKLLYDQNKSKRKVYYCKRCLQRFYTIEKLDDHMTDFKKLPHKKKYFQIKK